MFVKQIMQIGEKIEVVVPDISGNTSRVYYSMVQDIPSDEEILITVPISKGKPVALRMGHNIRVNFFRERGQFYFFAEVVERYKTGVMSLIRLKQTSQIFRLQRRNYYRLKTNVPVLFRIIKDNDATHDAQIYKGLIADISGGGIRLLTNIELKLGTCIECTISIQGELEVMVQGFVVRIVAASEASTAEYKYDIGIQFAEMPESIRHKIIQYIFETQRKQRRKERL